MPESHRYRIDTYHNSQPLGGDEFRPTRFVPHLAHTFVPGPIEPKRTLSGEGQATDIAAFITDAQHCGQHIAGARVTIKATITPETNGQTYFKGGEIGTGKFISQGYNAVLNPGGEHEKNTVIAGDTDIFGFFIARYQAQDHGALEKISFSVERPATELDPELKGSHVVVEELLIAIPNLVQITHENAPLAFHDGNRCVFDSTQKPHNPLPHWLTPNTRTRVMTLAAIYHYHTGRLLSLNDGSLPLGGVIARRRADKKEDRCHDSHRRGIDIDINSVDRLVSDVPGNESEGVDMRLVTTELNDRESTLLEYLDYWAERLGGRDFHGDKSIHYRFTE